jgi:FAD binding domain/Berberine and berberine like
MRPEMAIANRRKFLWQASLAATALWPGTKVLASGKRVLEDPPQDVVAIDPASIRRLASEISGNVITPEMPDYESARQVFNRAFDRHPAVIVRCAVASDVVRSLDFALTNNLQVAVRGGGHSRLGYGSCDGGAVIDLSAMKQIEIDVGKRTARAKAGALVHELDEATQRFELATTSGGCPTVGIAGLTLGGGEGRLMEKYGAACDNLISAQVVTVDGREIEASQETNADLFWAIRGGGGNFGVVTELEYQLHSLSAVLSGTLMYPAGRISELLHAFIEFLAASPDEMDALAQLLPSVKGPKLRIDVCYCGNPQMANDSVKPLRTLGPQDDSLRVMPYLEAQAAGGFLQTPVAHFQTDLFLRQLGVSEIAAITTAADRAPATCKIIIVPLRGAISRVPMNAMAFALRQPGYEVDMAGVWNTAAEKTEVVRWVRDTRDSLRPFAHGAYVNQLGDTSEELIKLAYGPNYDRLVAIKNKYDPNNILRLNQNLPATNKQSFR